MIERLGFKGIEKYCKEIQNHKYTCECGHRVFIDNSRKRKICTWCGRFVYKNKKDEFMDKLGSFINE